MKRLYAVKPRKDGRNDLCPICDSKLSYCSICEYCSSEKCSYADGYVRLTKKEAKKYARDKLQLKSNFAEIK